jgi:hypothetical protein
VGTVSAYEEIDCSTDAIFESNTCGQCFDWGTKTGWDYIGLLKDDWVNSSNSSRILYKEEQKMPNMVNLDTSSIVWSQTPWTDGFWEYSSDFDALYSEDEEWYILASGQRVTWLESKLGYAYKLDQNTAPENTNIGLLVYYISTHDILEDWTPSIDDNEHRECVLFKSAWESEPKEPEVPKKLPETGPTEYILLLILAMLLGFTILRVKNKA